MIRIYQTESEASRAGPILSGTRGDSSSRAVPSMPSGFGKAYLDFSKTMDCSLTVKFQVKKKAHYSFQSSMSLLREKRHEVKELTLSLLLIHLQHLAFESNYHVLEGRINCQFLFWTSEKRGKAFAQAGQQMLQRHIAYVLLISQNRKPVPANDTCHPSILLLLLAKDRQSIRRKQRDLFVHLCTFFYMDVSCFKGRR